MSSDEHEGDDFGDWEKLETIKTFDGKFKSLIS